MLRIKCAPHVIYINELTQHEGTPRKGGWQII